MDKLDFEPLDYHGKSKARIRVNQKPLPPSLLYEYLAVDKMYQVVARNDVSMEDTS